MNKQDNLRNMPIGKLLWSFSLPSIIAMVVNAIYNVVDRIFIGRFAGEEALAGLTVAFPVMMIIFAVATLIASGASALMAIEFGRKNNTNAAKIFGNAITVGIILNIIIFAILQIKMDSILNLFGADPGTLVMAKSYLRIILSGFTFHMLAFIFNFTVRSEGQAKLPMFAMILSAGSNIVLDALFIIVFNWGVQGAALATIIGQFTGFALLLSFYLKGKSILTLTKKSFILELNIVKNIIITGIATFATSIGNSIALGFLNQRLSMYGGTQAITSMGAINSIFTLFFMPLMGLQQGMQPIVGYNHGAELHDRVNKTLKTSMLWATAFSTFVFIILRVFPKALLSLFISPESNTMLMAVQGLNIYFLMLPVLGVNILGISFLQATAQGHKALILSMLRQFLCLIPLLTILPKFFGLTGVWSSVPGADAIAIIATAITLIWDYKKREASHNKTIDIELKIAN